MLNNVKAKNRRYIHADYLAIFGTTVKFGECVDRRTVKINRNNLSHNLFLKQEISRPEQKIN